MRLPAALLLTAIFYANIVWADSFKGTIKNDQIWKSDSGDYTIIGNVIVPKGVTLTMEEGTHIKIMGFYRFFIKGTLQIRGSKENPVILESGKDTVSVGDWSGIVFYGKEADGIIAHAVIRHAHKILCYKASPKFSNVLFEKNVYALYCSYLSTPQIYQCKMEKNNFGIYCDYSSPILQKNTIQNNEYGIYCVFSAKPVMGDNVITLNKLGNIKQDDILTHKQQDKVGLYMYKLMKDIF